MPHFIENIVNEPLRFVHTYKMANMLLLEAELDDTFIKEGYKIKFEAENQRLYRKGSIFWSVIDKLSIPIFSKHPVVQEYKAQVNSKNGIVQLDILDTETFGSSRSWSLKETKRLNELLKEI